jgi:formate-dependent nitrite reductase complex subunit NrfF
MRAVGIVLLLSLWVGTLHAQVVDTWSFSSEAEQKKALSIAAKIRCPQCQNQNLLGSNAPSSVAMRHQVFAMVEQGKTETDIISFMTTRYGNIVRYQPALDYSSVILWGLPPLLFAFIGITLWLRWRK